jgi:hypothetical protein
MTDDLREKVQLAVEAVTGDPFHDGAANAAIRAVLTHYAENGPTSEMVTAAHEEALTKATYAYPNGPRTYTVHATPQEYFIVMMRAALAEREK